MRREPWGAGQVLTLAATGLTLVGVVLDAWPTRLQRDARRRYGGSTL